jgi:hypothetical protein
VSNANLEDFLPGVAPQAVPVVNHIQPVAPVGIHIKPLPGLVNFIKTFIKDNYI